MSTLRDTMDLLGMPEAAEGWSSETDLAATPAEPDAVTDEKVESLMARARKVDPETAVKIDEVVAAAIALKKQHDLKLKQGQRTPGQLFRDLSPEKKAAVLATYQVTNLRSASQNHPLWIDRKNVPDTIVLAWFSPSIVSRLGMRGYRRVDCTPETQKWVPNARQLGSAKFITHANYTLCAIDSDTYLEREVQKYQLTAGVLDEEDERFRSALRSISGMIGLRKERAEQLDRTGRGYVATRGYDPALAQAVDQGADVEEARDLVRGQGD